MAVYGKAGTLGLGDLKGFQVLAELANELGGVISGVGRQGHHAVIVDPHHFHFVQVHQGAESLDGTRVAIVGGAGPEEVPGEGQAPALLLGEPVIARGPGVYHDQVRV